MLAILMMVVTKTEMCMYVVVVVVVVVLFCFVLFVFVVVVNKVDEGLILVILNYILPHKTDYICSHCLAER
jgi:hypothetical protein